MKMRYVLYILLTNVYAMADHSFTVEKYHSKQMSCNTEYILTSNNSADRVRFGVFSISDNVPSLIYVLLVENKDIENFTHLVCEVLSYLERTYNIIIKHACFSGPGIPSAQKDYLTHCRLTYAIDTKDIIKHSLDTAIIINDFLATS